MYIVVYRCISVIIMDSEKVKNRRIDELINKINYAENARDRYKETNPILSKTNSFYMDALKLELRALACSEKG
ncbi:MAG: hypothetical protein D3910_22820 [Candidatus Electrothrix sp. ATG2]|nr:hypothetical protein [Candidatus Electrothrix sp. ATG2]